MKFGVEVRVVLLVVEVIFEADRVPQPQHSLAYVLVGAVGL